MARHDSYQCFIDLYLKQSCCEIEVALSDIQAAESAMDRKLPTTYREFVMFSGVGDYSVPHDPPYAIAEFWKPDLILKQVKSPWMTPIPGFLNNGFPKESALAWDYLTPFGSEEAHGYWFCFPRVLEPTDDSPVLFFNHDGGEIEQIANGLMDFIEYFLQEM